MRTLFIILMWGFLTPSTAQTSDLTINVTNLKKNKGFLMVALYNHESKFLKIFDTTKRKKVTQREAVLVFEELPFGTYAVSIFQDINGNNSLDTNFLGIPNEPYGFSNNPSTIFGPPKFKKAAFKIDSSTKTITIKL